MKRFFPIVCALSMLAFVACTDDGNGGGDTGEIVVPPAQQENLSQEIGASATSGSGVTFTTAGAWTSTINAVRSGEADWVSITPDHGDAAGSYTISITLTPNETGEERKAEIIITCGESKIVITIVQSASDEPSQGGDKWAGFPVVPQNDRIAMIYKKNEVEGMSGTSCSYEKFEYDEQGRISKYIVGRQEPEGFHAGIYSYVYSADKIEIYEEYATETTIEDAALVQTAYLNNQGLVDRSVDDDSYTTTYTYTNAGRLATKVRPSHDNGDVVYSVEWSDEGAEISIANEIVGNLTWGTQFGWSGVDLSVSRVIGGGLGYWVVGGADAYNPVAITGLCGTFYDKMPATVNIDDLNGDGRTITGFDNFKYDDAARIIGFDIKLSTGGSDEIKIYYADNELPDVEIPGDDSGDEPSQNDNTIMYNDFPGPKIKALKQYSLTADGNLNNLLSTWSFKYEDSQELLTEVTQRWSDGEYDYEKYTFTYPASTDAKLVMKCDQWYRYNYNDGSDSNYEYEGYENVMTLNEKGYVVSFYQPGYEDEVGTLEYDEDQLVRLNYGGGGYDEYRWDDWTMVYKKYDEMGDGQWVQEQTFTPSNLYGNPFRYSQVDPTVLCEEEVGLLLPWAWGMAGGHNQALYDSISTDGGNTTIRFEYEFDGGEQIVMGNIVTLISRVTTSYTFSDGITYRECYLFEYYE